MVCSFCSAWLWILGAAPFHQTDTRALIEQALDEPVTFALQKVKLSDAIGIIGQETGVALVMRREAVELLPHGGDTLIDEFVVQNSSLRDGLHRILTKLGMQFVVTDRFIEIVPKPALLCLGRAATWTELDLLAWIGATQPGIDPQTLIELKERIQFQVTGPDPWNILVDSIRAVGAGPGDEVLTLACASQGWGWCLSEQWIVIAPVERQIVRRLQRPVKLQLSARPLMELFAALGERIGVAISVEPEAMASVPPPARRMGLKADGQSAELVLETIAVETGLGFLISPEGVRFYQPAERAGFGNEPPGRSPTSGSDPFVAKVLVHVSEGKSLEWLIRASELPTDLLDLRERDLQACFAELRARKTSGGP
jgi:hypothetical protein